MQRNENNNKFNKAVKEAVNLLSSLFKKELNKEQLHFFHRFLELPEDTIVSHIVPELNPKTTLNLALGNKSVLGMFKRKVFTLEAELAHFIVVQPNDARVRELLKKHPQLVRTKINRVTDQSERTIINATPLQLAYYAKDDTMCETIKPYIIACSGGEEAGIEEMRRQIKEKELPQSEESIKQAKEHLADLLATVIEAISNEDFIQCRRDSKTDKLVLSDATLKAITAFKVAFDGTQPKVIDKGMHFPLEILQEICEIYDNAAVRWNFSYHKCALFEDGVLAHVLTYVPANIAQEFNQGLYYRQDGHEAFKRIMKTRDGQNFYRHLRTESPDFQLSGACADIIYARRHGLLKVRLVSSVEGLRHQRLHKLCQTKALNLQNLCTGFRACAGNDCDTIMRRQSRS